MSDLPQKKSNVTANLALHGDPGNSSLNVRFHVVVGSVPDKEDATSVRYVRILKYRRFLA